MDIYFIAKCVGNFCAGIMIGIGVRGYVQWTRDLCNKWFGEDDE